LNANLGTVNKKMCFMLQVVWQSNSVQRHKVNKLSGHKPASVMMA